MSHRAMEEALRDIRDNFDHDAEAHHSGIGHCRVCLAMAALSVEGEAPAPTPSPAPEKWGCSRHAYFTTGCAVCESIVCDSGAGSPPSPSPSGEEEDMKRLVLKLAPLAAECVEAEAEHARIHKTKGGHSLEDAEANSREAKADRAWLEATAEVDEATVIDYLVTINRDQGRVISSLRGERDRAIQAAFGLAHSEHCPLTHEPSGVRIRCLSCTRADLENSALRTRAEKAEADVQNDYKALWEADAADLASAREALRKYGRHRYGCPRNENKLDCTCGLEKALSGAPPAPAPTSWDNLRDTFYRAHPGLSAPKPVAQEDAPAPTTREEVMPSESSDRLPVRTVQQPGLPAIEPPSVAGAGAPSPDLEGLIDNTVCAHERAWKHVGGHSAGCDDQHCEEARVRHRADLRSFASEVSRLTREPLEEPLRQLRDVRNVLGIDATTSPAAGVLAERAEAERKLSEVTQERDRLLEEKKSR